MCKKNQLTTFLNHINPWNQTSECFVSFINKLKYSSVTLMKHNKPWAFFHMLFPNHYNVNFSTLHFSFLLPFLFEYGIIGNEVAIFCNTSLKHNNARKCQTKRKSFLWPCLNIFLCYTNVIIFFRLQFKENGLYTYCHVCILMEGNEFK